MHELSIAIDAIDLVSANLAQYPGARVEIVRLSVGIYSGIDPRALEFCFPLASEGTPVEGAKLHIETIPLRIQCHECEADPVISDSLECPLCGSPRITVVSGRDLTLTSLDLILPDEEDA